MPPVKTLRKRGWKKLRPRPNENNQREKILFFESILNHLPPSWYNNDSWTYTLIHGKQVVLMPNNQKQKTKIYRQYTKLLWNSRPIVTFQQVKDSA